MIMPLLKNGTVIVLALLALSLAERSAWAAKSGSDVLVMRVDDTVSAAAPAAVPDGGSTVLLLGAAVAAMGVAHRRIRR